MHTEKIKYKEGSTEFEAYVVYDETIKTKRPGILVGHAWPGRDDFVEEKAREIAKLGYVAFAWDLYGDGRVYTDHKQMYALLEDRALLRRRLLAALDVMKKLPLVDETQLGSTGFCFGGLASLDLARAGVDLKGVVSFHGSLSAPGIPNQPMKSKILVLHGHDDTMVPPEAVTMFEEEMVASRVEDWQVHVFGNTHHAFTIPANRPDLGFMYSKRSTERAWKMMIDFFKECFE